VWLTGSPATPQLGLVCGGAFAARVRFALDPAGVLTSYEGVR
jgi:hypothetical protein